MAFGGEGQGGVPYGETWLYSNGSWTSLTPTNGVSPTPRFGAGLAFDPSTNTTVLFGGYSNYGRPDGSGYLLNDTWEYSRGTWTNVSGSVGVTPRARWDASMDTDASDGGVLLFGGRTDTKAPLSVGTATSDTWLFREGAWHKLLAAGLPSSPSARYGAASSEGSNGAVFVYSGSGGTLGSIADLWKFQKGVWSQMSIPYGSAGIVQDATLMETDSGSLVLFGGCMDTLVGHCAPSDLCYVLGPNGFLALSGATPSARWGAAGAYDGAANDSLLFGGITGTGGGGFLAQAWQYTNASGWNATVVVPQGPASLAGAATTFDPTLGGVLAFGGGYGSNAAFYPGYAPAPAVVSNQTWLFSAGSWKNLSDPTSSAPSPRWDAGLAYDARAGYDVLFGGIGPGCGYVCVLADTWLFQNGSWKLAPGTGGAGESPPAHELFDMAYDPQLACVVLYGGAGSNETWLFCDGTWTDATALLGASPPAREGAMMAYDSATETMVLFGGYNVIYTGATQYRDIWGLANGSWEPLDGVGAAPAPLTGGTFVDSGRGYLLLFGGLEYPTTAPELSNSTWEFNGTAWTDLSATVGPPPTPRYQANGGIYPNGSFVLLFSGCTNTACTGGPSDTWAFGRIPPLAASLSLERTVTNVGQPVTLYASRVGGWGNTTGISYSGLPQGCASLSVTELPCTPTAVGWSNISVTIVDEAGQRAASRPIALEVIPPLTATIFASASAVDVRQVFSIAGAYTGGLPPVSVGYSGLPSGCLSANAAVIYCTPVAPGTFSIVVMASDATGFTSNSSAAIVRVGGPLSVALAASPSVVDEGSSLLLQATPIGGVAPYVYLWGGLPPGCYGSYTPTITCSPESPGAYLVSVSASDAASEFAYQTLLVIVNLPPFGVASATAPSSCNGPFVSQLTAEVQGGTPNLTYNWTLGDGTYSQEGPTLEHFYPGPGLYHATLVVTDASGRSAVLPTDVSIVRICPSGGGGSSFAPGPGITGPIAGLVLVAAAGAAALAWITRRRWRRPSGKRP